MRALLGAPDLFDSEHGQFLSVTAFAPVILTALFLEHDDLGAARLLHDARAHRCVGHRRGADRRGVIAADREHLAQLDIRADLALDALDRDLGAYADAILLSACPYDGKHPINPNLLSYRSRAAVSNWLRRSAVRRGAADATPGVRPRIAINHAIRGFSVEAQSLAAFRRDHLRSPGRIPHQVHVGLADPGQREQFLARVDRDR